MKCVCNEIVKLFKVKILCYVERIREMHDLEKYLPPPYMKRESVMADNWNIRNKEITTSDLRLAIKDGIPKSMRDEQDEHPENYHSLTYEDWCDLLSTIKVKYERKTAAVQINKIASVREASLYDTVEYMRIPRNKKSKTGVLRSNTSPKMVHSRHHGIQRYFVLCKNSGMPNCKYTLHSAEDFTGVCTNRSIKDVLGRPMGSRTYSVKQYKKSENKRKKELKALNKQNKMIYGIAKKSGSRREIKKIKKIRAKASKKSSDSSSDD